MYLASLRAGSYASSACPKSLTFSSIAAPDCKCHDRTHTFSPVIKWNFVLMALFGRVVFIIVCGYLLSARRFYAVVLKSSVFFLRPQLSIFFCYCSTREIKPNQTDIGRKITKKPSAIAPSLYNGRTTTSGQASTPNSSLISNGIKRQLDTSERGSADGSQQTQQQSMSHLSSQQQLSASSHSYNTASSQDHRDLDPYQHHNNSALNGVVGDDVDHHPRAPSNMNLSRNGGQQNHRNPDIMRKPIK